MKDDLNPETGEARLIRRVSLFTIHAVALRSNHDSRITIHTVLWSR